MKIPSATTLLACLLMATSVHAENPFSKHLHPSLQWIADLPFGISQDSFKMAFPTAQCHGKEACTVDNFRGGCLAGLNAPCSNIKASFAGARGMSSIVVSTKSKQAFFDLFENARRYIVEAKTERKDFRPAMDMSTLTVSWQLDGGALAMTLITGPGGQESQLIGVYPAKQ